MGSLYNLHVCCLRTSSAVQSRGLVASAAVAVAAKSGELEIVQWLRERDCRWDFWVCSDAAQSGHLEILQWAREAGCPWSERTCATAAKAGDWVMLQWARGQGCPWD